MHTTFSQNKLYGERNKVWIWGEILYYVSKQCDPLFTFYGGYNTRYWLKVNYIVRVLCGEHKIQTRVQIPRGAYNRVLQAQIIRLVFKLIERAGT